MKKLFPLFLFLVLTTQTHSQGFLHTNGKTIVNGDGEEVILRGIGTGNWMLQEGYMMQSSDIGGTQHEFRKRLTETIGEAKTDSFYNAWLQHHFSRTDVDSMKSWGYNSVRVAMHYKWFTPPIEEEPVAGEITWLNKGFVMIDSLLGWCEDNEMYLILDLHGAPGGQGKDANISDYDPSKPSLWESELNKEKTVALWGKLAERFADEPWIGGYDLINETNWPFPEGNNSQMRELFGRITDAIREVDDNHIIYIEGNGFANDFSGLIPPWDNNMVYSFHKYWNYNKPGAIDWVLAMRDEYDIPIWLGETGENSNTWFTNLIALCESHKVGWSWWPVKKPGINNPLRVIVNEDYTRLIDFWKGTGPELSEDEAFEAVLQFAENHKIENCVFQKDVVDAKIRQPHTTATLPFISRTVGERIYFSDYDLGRNKYAYLDNDTANYRLEEGQDFTNWNQGWAYRNDGVDIEECSDDVDQTNGYNVGWTEDGEWMLYTISSDSAVSCDLEIRYASGGDGGLAHFEIDDVPVTKSVTLPSTGGWQQWETVTVNDVLIPDGSFKLKFVVDQGGVNLNHFFFVRPASVGEAEIKPLTAEVVFPGNKIRLTLNQPVSDDLSGLLTNDFSVTRNEESLLISAFRIDPSVSRVLDIELDDFLDYGESAVISYDGTAIVAGDRVLGQFENLNVRNNLPVRFNVPGRIEAEDFYTNNGFELEESQDQGGGQNTAYANAGDYVEYNVHVTDEATYSVDYRVATERSQAQVIFQIEQESVFVSLDTMTFSSTGGWQNWETQSAELSLPQGRYKVRLLVLNSEYNLNWFDLSVASSVHAPGEQEALSVSPVPANDYLNITLPFVSGENILLQAYDGGGRLVRQWNRRSEGTVVLDITGLKPACYVLIARGVSKTINGKFIVVGY